MLDEAQVPTSRKCCGTVNGAYSNNSKALISGVKSARLKPLKKVEHVVISLAEPNYREVINKTRSNAIASPSGIMDGTHY